MANAKITLDHAQIQQCFKLFRDLHLYGMTTANCQPHLTYECLQLLCNHYPERLGLVICIRPGLVFKVVWHTIKPFLPPDTAAKVVLIKNPASLEENLAKYFAPEMTIWIKREHDMNRVEEVQKRYRQFWLPPVIGHGSSDHDARGTNKYLAEWISLTHLSGHRPHPNIADQLEGRMDIVGTSPISSEGFQGGITIDEANNESTDKAEVGKLIRAVPDNYRLPKDAQQLE